MLIIKRAVNSQFKNKEENVSLVLGWSDKHKVPQNLLKPCKISYKSGEVKKEIWISIEEGGYRFRRQ
jgi:hypothetical protein